MSKKNWVRCSALALTTVGFLALYDVTTAGQGQEGGAAVEASMPMPQPTAQHRSLQDMAGVWAAEVTMFLPGGEEMKMTGVEKNVMLGELWLLSDFDGDMAGMPFKGQGALGYDPDQEEFVGTWIDNTTPKLTVMAGERDDDGALVMRYEAVDMMGKMAEWESVQTTVDKNKRTYTAFLLGEDDEKQKAMEISYTRRGDK